MTEKELNNEYFDWMCQLVCNERYSRGLSYQKLLRHLHNIDFQKKLLTKVAKEKGYTNLVHFLDDGISGITMDRPGFVEMIR